MEKIKEKLEKNIELNYDDKLKIICFINDFSLKNKELDNKLKDASKREEIAIEMIKKNQVTSSVKIEDNSLKFDGKITLILVIIFAILMWFFRFRFFS